jgi:hypothetical protein
MNQDMSMDPLLRVIVFDLDGTLSLSKSRITDRMATLLTKLLSIRPVCIISGSKFEQFEIQVLDQLPVVSAQLTNLHLMPTCGTRYYRWRNNAWYQVYAEELSAHERDVARRTLVAAVTELGLWESRTWGEVIEDRGTQVTFSALGQAAPPAVKSVWDPNGEKKSALRRYVADRLPDLEVRTGGETSIDITKKGIDKAFGIRRLIEAVGISRDQVIFIGDRLDENGNDYPVKAMGIRCVQVSNYVDTAQLIEDLLIRLSPIPSDNLERSTE